MKTILIVLCLFLVGCATSFIGDPTHNQGHETVQTAITQESVVNTSFENSWIFSAFSTWRTEGPLIPGLEQQFIPQGMDYWEDENLLVISNYMDNFSAGALTFIDMHTGLLQKVLFLNNQDGTPHTGHLGGVAISDKHLWCASGPGVYAIPLEKIIAAEPASFISLPEIITTESKASFATYHDGVLWVGEFVSADGNYRASETHRLTTRSNGYNRAWLCGYNLDPVTDTIQTITNEADKLIPDVILSIPDEIQGALFAGDRIYLSASYGRKNNSRLLIFRSPLNEQPHQEPDPAAENPGSIWFLDDLNKMDEIILPPMSEAVTQYAGMLAVLFESSATRYRQTASKPVDRIQFLSFDISSK